MSAIPPNGARPGQIHPSMSAPARPPQGLMPSGSLRLPSANNQPPTQGSILEGREYIILIDQSGSMEEEDIRDPYSGKVESRWNAVKEGVVSLAAKVLALDPDGIDVYTFSKRFDKRHVTAVAQVKQIFEEEEPLTSTNLCGPMDDALKGYFATRDVKCLKGATLLVVTDGRPNNPEGVIDLIVKATQQVRQPKEVGISFIQIGSDTGATQFLQYLDDNLGQRGARHDIVDTKNWDYVEERGFKKVLLEALNG